MLLWSTGNATSDELSYMYVHVLHSLCMPKGTFAGPCSCSQSYSRDVVCQRMYIRCLLDWTAVDTLARAIQLIIHRSFQDRSNIRPVQQSSSRVLDSLIKLHLDLRVSPPGQCLHRYRTNSQNPHPVHTPALPGSSQQRYCIAQGYASHQAHVQQHL